MKFCPQCGSTFESGARFCQECGFDIQSVGHAASGAGGIPPGNPDADIHTPSKPTCSKCGTSLEPEDRFCPGCGFDNQSVKAEPVAKPQAEKPVLKVDSVLPPVPLPIAPAPESLKPVCPKCGTNLEAEERFCPGCGFDNQSIKPEPVAKPQAEKPVLKADSVLPPVPLPITPAPESLKPVCPKCGTNLEAEERFCPGCGFDNQSIKPEPVAKPQAEKPVLKADSVLPPVPLPIAPAPESLKPVCPKCGTNLEAEERFCPGCGFDNQSVKPEPVAKPQAERPVQKIDVVVPPVTLPETPVHELQQTTCPKCGVVMLADDVFCQECGYKTGESISIAAAEKPITPTPSTPIAPPGRTKTPPVVPPPVRPTAEEQSPSPKKKNKLLLVLLLVLLAIAMLGGSGYYGYKKFFQNSEQTIAAASDIDESIPDPNLMDENLQSDTTSAIEPVENQVEKPEPEKKATPPKTKPGKKKAEPKVVQPEKEEPAKPNEPMTVIMKPETVKKTPRSLYNNFNTEEVKNGPKSTNKIKFKKPTMITRIITFHHNNGNGAPAGTITLEGKKNETGGPWQARNAPGSDGTENGKWICEPNARMEAGTYKIEVSDDNSWSFNGKSSRKGFVIVEGYEID